MTLHSSPPIMESSVASFLSALASYSQSAGQIPVQIVPASPCCMLLSLKQPKYLIRPDIISLQVVRENVLVWITLASAPKRDKLCQFCAFCSMPVWEQSTTEEAMCCGN